MPPSDLPTPSLSRVPRWLRGVVFVAAVVYMQIGSFARMGLDIRTGPGFMSWRMYHSRGHDQCKLWAYEHRAGRGVFPIDWTERLEWEPGNRQRRVSSPKDAKQIAERLCRKTRLGRGISVVTQCSRHKRWQPPSDTKDDIICRGSRP